MASRLPVSSTSPPSVLGASSGHWIACWLIAFAVGCFQALATRFDMNPDGISYLNLSDQYSRGDWSGAVNSYWSPLYPLLLSMTVRLAGARGYWEAPIVHAVNFLVYLATFASFLFFLRQLTALQCDRQSRLRKGLQVITFTRPIEVWCAFALFLWSALVLIGIGNVTPDMLLAGIVYGIAGVMVKLRGERPHATLFVFLGLLLGLAYLTKAVMFPIGFIVALGCAVRLGSLYFITSRTLLVLVTFLAVASPQVHGVSRLTGHLSYGESGTLNYATIVNRFPVWWVGEPARSGVPTHPIRRFQTKPSAYEFSSDATGSSYPFWDAPAHWADGIRPSFSFREQWRATKPLLYMYLTLLGSLLFALCVLLLSRVDARPQDFVYLILPSIGAFLLYSLVHAEARFFGAWITVLFLAAVSSLAFRTRSMRGVYAVLATLALFKLTSVADQLVYPVRQSLRDLSGNGPRHFQSEIAAGLRSLGLLPGSRVASIGRSFDGYWARLAGVQIAMEIPEADAPVYWSASDSLKGVIHDQFERRGAEAVVTNRPPAVGPGPEWIPLGNGHFVLRIPSIRDPRRPDPARREPLD